MRQSIKIIVLILAVLAMAATASATDYHSQVDQDSDGEVNFIDFALFADDWQKTEPNLASDFDGSGTVDIYDLDIFCDYWLFGIELPVIPPTAPVADDINVSAYTFQTTPITLTATGDRPIAQYIITSLPANATLQDPCSGSGFVDGNMLPYALSFSGSTIWFAAESNSSPRTFTFKAYDGNSQSNTATVTVTVLDHPRDLLSFDGQGSVKFSDNNYYDINNGWATDFWLRTREPFTGLLKKRDANQGWEIGITSGKPKIYIYDNNGLVVAEARSFYRIDDGTWHEVGFNFNQDVNGIYLRISLDIGWELFTIAGSYGSFQNDCNLLLGLNSKQGYRGDVDMLRFFSGITDPAGIDAIIQGFLNRDGSGFESWMVFGKASVIRYPINEGSGLTVTDDKLGLTGVILDSNHVRWYPFYWPFEDVSVQRSYRRSQ